MTDPVAMLDAQAAKAMAVSHEEWERLRTSALLDLKPRSLGSCALVGNSRNLLKGARGADILSSAPFHSAVNSSHTRMKHRLACRPMSTHTCMHRGGL